MGISERLQKLRKHERYSQEQLAEKLGVTRQAISKWESSQGNPDINNIHLLKQLKILIKIAIIKWLQLT